MTAFSVTELNVWNLARQHWTAAIHLLKDKAESRYLKVHKREKFFSSDFEFFTILYLVKLKY